MTGAINRGPPTWTDFAPRLLPLPSVFRPVESMVTFAFRQCRIWSKRPRRGPPIFGACHTNPGLAAHGQPGFRVVLCSFERGFDRFRQNRSELAGLF